MSIRGRLVASHFVLALVVVLLVGLVAVGRVRTYILSAAKRTLTTQAEQIGQVIDRRSLGELRPSGVGGAAFARLVSQLTAADFLVLDRDGRVVASSERLGRFAGSRLRTGLFAKALDENRTVSDTYRDPLGRLSVMAVVPIQGEQGSALGVVALVRPVGEVTRTTAGFLLLIGEALLLGLALSLLISLLLARSLTRPLRALEVAAATVASGDFTQRVPVEADDELGRLASAFNSMAERLGELERERRELYASVSHELRTPVTSIKGFAQALEDNVGGPEERQRHLAIIQEEASRLERLVADLFQLARLEARQVTFEWRRVDLAALVTGTVEKYRPQATAAQVSLALASGAGGDLWARADPDRLNQVLGNLIENALRFTPAGGRITVGVGPDRFHGQGARRGEGFALVTVGDSGPGIPPEDLGRVFERFYTVDRSRARSKGGTGLGLAIAKELVEAHGGRIWAERGPDGGALLSFTVPLEKREPPGGGKPN